MAWERPPKEPADSDPPSQWEVDETARENFPIGPSLPLRSSQIAIPCGRPPVSVRPRIQTCGAESASIDSAMAEISLGLSFDDVLLVPALSAVLPGEADLSTHVTAGIPLFLPVVSAAMEIGRAHV